MTSNHTADSDLSESKRGSRHKGGTRTQSLCVLSSPDDFKLGAGAFRVIPRGDLVPAVDRRDVGRGVGVGVRVLVERVVSEGGATGE